MWLTASEAAKALGVTPQTVTKLIRDGALAAMRTRKNSGHYRIPREALETYMNENITLTATPL